NVGQWMVPDRPSLSASAINADGHGCSLKGQRVSSLASRRRLSVALALVNIPIASRRWIWIRASSLVREDTVISNSWLTISLVRTDSASEKNSLSNALVSMYRLTKKVTALDLPGAAHRRRDGSVLLSRSFAANAW